MTSFRLSRRPDLGKGIRVSFFSRGRPERGVTQLVDAGTLAQALIERRPA